MRLHLSRTEDDSAESLHSSGVGRLAARLVDVVILKLRGARVDEVSGRTVLLE